MKPLVFCCLFVFVVSEALGLGYHQDVGIPEAARIRELETRQMTSRIIGGQPSQNSDNPHLVGLIVTLTTKQMSVCSGTWLGSNKVLTAAQCWFDGYSQGMKMEAVLGATKLFYGWRNEVLWVSVHPGFDPTILKDDLAMLTLKWYEGTSRTQMPARLPSLNDVSTSFAGLTARVSGFGKTSDLSTVGPETSQHAVSVLVSSNSYYSCYQKLAQRPDNYRNLICASGATAWVRGTCGGDLGGPLVLKNYYNQTAAISYNGSALLIGVTSIQSPFGCQTAFPTGYMRVTSYLSWIQSNL